MVDQLIFWYRAATASADTAVLTARTALSCAFGRGGGGVSRGPGGGGKRVDRGDAGR